MQPTCPFLYQTITYTIFQVGKRLSESEGVVEKRKYAYYFGFHCVCNS